MILYAILTSTKSYKPDSCVRYARKMPGTSDVKKLLSADSECIKVIHRRDDLTSHGEPPVLLERKHHPFPVGCNIYMIIYIYIHLHLTFNLTVKFNSYNYSSVCMRMCIISSLLQIHPSNPMKPWIRPNLTLMIVGKTNHKPSPKSS